MPSISVACKVPQGLILRNFKMNPRMEAAAGGGFKEVKQAELDGEPININGPAVRFGAPQRHRVINGYAITEGVDEAAFNRWIKDNADHPAVRSGLIVAAGKQPDLEAKTREGRDVLTGLQPLDPKDDKRLPRGGSNVVVSVATKE